MQKYYFLAKWLLVKLSVKAGKSTCTTAFAETIGYFVYTI